MRILITGANGFIGSYISSYFLQKGHYIIASTLKFHESTRELLKNAELLEFDVLDFNALKEITIEADYILHLATANDIISKDTSQGINLSAVGTRNILEFAIRCNIPKCIVFSTFQVYGTELAGTISDISPLNFQNDYGINHLFAEMYAEMYSRKSNISCVSVRPSNVYGRVLTKSFNRWTLVPACFCKEALENGSITIKSSGKQMRNFVSLENLSRAIERIMLKFPNQYESFNLASTKNLTMIEVANIVKHVCKKEYNKTIQINICGVEPATTNYFSVDLTRLKSIGFTEDENYSLESEIKEILKYIQSKN